MFPNSGTSAHARKTKNGLGLSIAQADSHLKRLERFFTFLPDTEEVYRNWRELVVNHSVSGVKVHDAKIVAAMKAHNIQNLLTFNAKDFKRYADIKAVEPKDVSIVRIQIGNLITMVAISTNE